MNRIAILAGLLLITAIDPARSQTGGVARVVVRLPRDARLYVDEVFCPLTGEQRTFDTPPLDPDRKYSYTLTVEITHETKPVRLKRQIIVQANRATDYDFGDRAAILAAAMKEANREDKETGKPPELPKGVAPTPAMASVKGGEVSISIPVCKHVVEKVSHEIIEGGMKKTVFKEVKKTVCVLEQRIVSLKKVKIFDISGERITDERAAELLAKDRVVLLSETEKVDPFYLSTTKPGTLLLFMPPGEIPSGTVPTPMPMTDPKKPATRPMGVEPRLQSAILDGGSLVYDETVVVKKEVEETKSVTGPDGKPMTVIVKKPVFVEEKRKVKLDPKLCHLSTVAGEKVAPANLARFMGDKPTAIIVSVDFMPVDAFYLQLRDKGMLVVVPPGPRDSGESVPPPKHK